MSNNNQKEGGQGGTLQGLRVSHKGRGQVRKAEKEHDGTKYILNVLHYLSYVVTYNTNFYMR